MRSRWQLRYARKTARYIPGILQILITKKLDEKTFFFWNTLCEEPPRDYYVEHQANRIGENKLRSHAPQKPTKITGMATQTVHTLCHQGMRSSFMRLNDVCEVR